MDGFVQMIQDELTATPAPRRVVLRSLGDAIQEWGQIFVFLVLALFWSCFVIRFTVNTLLLEHGVQTTAKVMDSFTSMQKGRLYHYLHVTFPDQAGAEKTSDICVSGQEYAAHPIGETVAIHYIPGFTQWAVSNQNPPNPYSPYLAGFFAISGLSCFLFPAFRKAEEYQYFKYGIFAKGTVTNFKEQGGGLSGKGRGAREIIRVEYVLNGVKNETVVNRPKSDNTLNNEAAVVVMPDKPGKIRVFFSNDNCSIFQVRVPDSFYNQ
jgi:hypothetical protein